ncbi:transcription initiation factor IIA large subunit [Sporobolomyces salmoneus]|uniref:transcription initiation factor IIA large subunit n=1 Tax=Sporobolomyces salmoneus TaxID=183962 RepID=UPI00316D2B51
MSNKQVPAVYRSIIDDVITQVRPEFEQIGVEEAVLQELLRLWELKLAQSRVADFSSDDRMGPVAQQFLPLTIEEVKVNHKLREQEQLAQTKGGGGGVKKEGGSEEGKVKGEGEDGDDEDAINSDLDSSEDELDEEAEAAAQGEDQGGDIVIALYEKVQRVKNKWKVTLKDGLISVNGKDYLFSKCNGEFEW